MAAQFLTTSKLNNIINMIALGRQSGFLRVIRGQGQTREIGQIKFMDGEPASALLGQLTGNNALTVLMNWGECIYSFDEYASGDLADTDANWDGLGRSSSSPSSDSGRYTPPSGATSGSWPSYNTPSGYPQSQPPRSGTPLPGPSSANIMPSGPLGGGVTSSSLPAFPSQNGAPPPGARYSGESFYDAPPFPGNGSMTQPTMAGSASGPLTTRTLMTVPRRSVIAEQVEQLPLDRRERMLLLLVDSRRNLSDLARLTRRSEREVLNVLEHLSTLGLVRIDG